MTNRDRTKQDDSSPLMTMRESFGNAELHYKYAKSILTKPSGFIQAYDFTLNPYQGCQYACSYCYAAAFSPNQQLRQNWGDWVVVKQNAEEVLRKELERWYRKNIGQRPKIYMSSVTDPYQPIESKIQLTHALLHTMQEFTPTPTLVIQTRSPLILRDIDLLQRFEQLRVNMSIPTGSEQVRRDFELRSPSIQARLTAIQRIRTEIDPAKGFAPKISITITPTLPTLLDEQDAFIKRMKFVDRVVVQKFHPSDHRSLVAGTREEAQKLQKKYLWWYEHENDYYQRFKERLFELLPGVEILEGREGFGYQ